MLSLLFLFLGSLTNDMPVVDPKGFDTFRLVPFQINRIFKKGNAPVELSPADDFSFLL